MSRRILFTTGALPRTSSLAHTSTSLTCTRTTHSYRRARSKLNVPPTAELRPLPNSEGNHITFTPPSSAPSVLHTPTKFLPRSDPRYALLVQTAAHVAPPLSLASSAATGAAKTSSTPSRSPPTTTTSSSSLSLPPILPRTRTDYPRHELGLAEIDEMRRLCATDPQLWTRNRLATHFGCSRAFVSMVATHGAEERRETHRRQLDVVRERWGTRRRMAREDRRTRKEMAKSDEYQL